MIAGGQSNTISAICGSIIGGLQNNIPAGCSFSSILGGANITATQSNTAYTQRLTTVGGRQKKHTRVTNTNITLGLDDHFVTIYNTSGNVTVFLPLIPIDGQEYNIKCMLATGTVTITGKANAESSDGRRIQSVANITPYPSFTMLGCQAAHMIYSSPDGNWCMMT